MSQSEVSARLRSTNAGRFAAIGLHPGRSRVPWEGMRAMAIDRRPAVGEFPRALRMRELPVPPARRGEVRLRVEASAVNVDDQHLAEGSMFGGFPIAPRATRERPWIPGADLAGTVDEVGRGVTGLEPGQRVYGLRMPWEAPGPWAEFGVVRATHVAPVPQGWSAPEAASLCVSGTVVCSILKLLGEPRGKRCLVVGASGSIGTLLVPALHRAGARVWGVCSARNQALVEGLGAERALDYREGPFGDQVVAAGVRFDAVVDLVGGLDVEAQARGVTAPEGAFVTAVGPERYVGERRLGARGLAAMLGHMAWSWGRSRVWGPRYRFAGPLGPDFAAIDRWIVAQGIRPTLDQVVPFDEGAVRDAVAYVSSHRARGKVVIAMPGA
jgi:alcohol dehydrogenase